MDIQSLIRLAHQADLEGNYRVADKLTERAIREAQFWKNIGRNVGEFLGNMNIGRGSKEMVSNPANFGSVGDFISHGAHGASARSGNAGAAGAVSQMAETGSSMIENEAEAGAKATARGTSSGTSTKGSSGGTSTKGGRARANADARADATSRGGDIELSGSSRGGNSGAATGGAGGSGGDQNVHMEQTYSPTTRIRSHDYTGATVGMGAAGSVALATIPTAIIGALGAYGLSVMNGKVVDQRGNPVPPQNLPPQVKQLMSGGFKANQLSERAQAHQMGNAQAAQNFIESNRTNPKFKSAQDFYYAAQAAGMNQSDMNQIAALAKAEGYSDKTPMMN